MKQKDEITFYLSGFVVTAMLMMISVYASERAVLLAVTCCMAIM